MPIRVLVVDDALVARRVVCRALDAEEDLQVAGAAWDAETALTKARELEPDVVVLDLELPGTSGLETLRMLRALDGSLPVVIFSHLAVPGSEVADRVIAAGASGVVVKPTGATGVGMTLDHVGHRLAPMLRRWPGAARCCRHPPPSPSGTRPCRRRSSSWARPRAARRR
jgi:two-component system chemotaxis response regulator CheB